MREKLLDVCREFRISGDMVSYEEIKVGNVNRTYKVNFVNSDGFEKSYMVQSINTFVFKNPVGVMENIDRVTEHIRAKRGNQVSLHFHHTADGKNYVSDGDEFWRLFNYVVSDTYNATSDLAVVRNAGGAFGEFQMLLSDFDASQLVDTIPDFHDTRKRFETLWKHVEEDPCGKVAEVREELDWLASVMVQACHLTDLYRTGSLPLRVTHNDTKINNVLFDKTDKSALVVIDLDTVMPGLVGNDFGDAIRSAANYVEEDCADFDRAGVDLDVFRAFAEGFLSYTAETLEKNEIDTLALSCFSLTTEQAVRFLDDYILGSPYYKVDYPEHNLVRARCQIALAKDMLVKMDDMERIVGECVR